MNDALVELLDDAFRNVHNARGAGLLNQSARALAIEFRQGVLCACAALTGMPMEDLYETYQERLIAAHEVAIAREIDR